MSTSATEVADGGRLDHDDLTVPRYGEASLADVVPGVCARLLGDDDAVGPAVAAALPEGVRGVVVLVVDGLGSQQLAAAPDAAPLLTALPGTDVDAVFPSTTVASIASIGTGRPPSQHGLVGYTFAVDGHDQPLNGLGWRIGLRGGGFDAREVVVPEAVQPQPTAFEASAAAGIATTVVVDPLFPDSGLTRAALRGGERRTARGLTASLELAVDAVTTDGPALAYVHHPFVDWAGHVHGALSPEWRDTVADVDRDLTALRDTLPPDIAVLVTADHGMLTIDPADMLELADRDDLLDGVRVLAGEPRVRQLALEPDADPDEVAARWRSALGDRAVVLNRDEALPLFGPDPTPTARRHVGDVVVVSRRGTLVHERVDPHGGRHLGQHGGATAAERLVPLRRLERP